MSEMVERLKRVLNEAYQTAGQTGHLRTAPLSDHVAEALVFAMLKAMRHPTETMMAATDDPLICDGSLEQAWRAMIDAALLPDPAAE